MTNLSLSERFATNLNDAIETRFVDDVILDAILTTISMRASKARIIEVYTNVRRVAITPSVTFERVLREI